MVDFLAFISSHHIESFMRVALSLVSPDISVAFHSVTFLAFQLLLTLNLHIFPECAPLYPPHPLIPHLNFKFSGSEMSFLPQICTCSCSWVFADGNCSVIIVPSIFLPQLTKSVFYACRLPVLFSRPAAATLV